MADKQLVDQEEIVELVSLGNGESVRVIGSREAVEKFRQAFAKRPSTPPVRYHCSQVSEDEID